MSNTATVVNKLEQAKPMYPEFPVNDEHTFLGSINLGGVGYDLYVRIGAHDTQADYISVNKDTLGNLRVQIKSRADVYNIKGSHPLRVAMFIVDIEYNLQ